MSKLLHIVVILLSTGVFSSAQQDAKAVYSIRSNLIASDPIDVKNHDAQSRVLDNSNVQVMPSQFPMPQYPLIPPMPPIPIPMPVVLPSMTVFEPVYHDHPPMSEIREIIENDKKRHRHHSRSEEETYEESSSMDTDTSSSFEFY